MNKTTQEVYLNCKEQGLLDEVVECYAHIILHNLNLDAKQGGEE